MITIAIILLISFIIILMFKLKDKSTDLSLAEKTIKSLDERHEKDVLSAKRMKELALCGINYRIIFLVKLFGEDLTDRNALPQDNYMGKVLWFKNGPYAITLAPHREIQGVIGILFSKHYDSPKDTGYIIHEFHKRRLLSGTDCGLSLVCGERKDGSEEIWDYVDLCSDYDERLNLLNLIENDVKHDHS